jgi:hypothetical protein
LVEDNVPEKFINNYNSRLRSLLRSHFSKPKQDTPSAAVVEEAIENEKKKLEKKQAKKDKNIGKKVIADEPLKASIEASSSNEKVQEKVNIKVINIVLCFFFKCSFINDFRQLYLQSLLTNL